MTEPNNNQWQKSLLATAIIAGVFSAAVLSLLAVNYVRAKVIYPLKSERLELLKLKISETPNDQNLLEQIRQLDLEIRQYALDKTQLSRPAVIFLIFGIVICLACLQIRDSLHRKTQIPPPDHDRPYQQLKNSYLTRTSLLTLIIIIITTSLFYIINQDSPVVETATESAPYPTIEQLRSNWPRFRGFAGASHCPYTDIPTQWSESQNQNILWKSPVPLAGFNSPIIWQDKIFLAGATQTQRQVYCYSLNDGTLKWTVDIPGPTDTKVEVMEDTGLAAPTLTTDGRAVYAIFPTGDIAAITLTGKIIWHRSLGVPENAYGYATSLLMYQNRLIVQYDQATPEDNKSKLLALDYRTGQTIREKTRPVGNAWTTPIIAEINGTAQLITVAEPYTIAYNPADFTEIWRVRCIGADAGASPIYAAPYIITVSPYEEITAINPTGTGDITDTNIVWTTSEGLPDTASPLSDENYLYVIETYGTLTCLNLKTGQKIWDHTFDTSFQASPSLSADKIYLIGAEGTSFVIQAGPEYKQIAQCDLAEGALASPAFAPARMIIRTKNYLYCVSSAK